MGETDEDKGVASVAERQQAGAPVPSRAPSSHPMAAEEGEVTPARGLCPIIVCAEGGDHLYETCPHARRESVRFGARAVACVCSSKDCDPLDETVCGWCRRVWRSRHAASAIPAPHEERTDG
jgi:hypothetical protein